MSAHKPIDELRELAGRRASGELICVAPELELHVYLQAGTIAWATDSARPFAFVIHLQESAGIDAETIRQLVEECRRERLPLGETIVAWGIATWETVRASLHHQVARALQALIAADAAARTLFLDREYAGYNERLTFTLEELLTTCRVPSSRPPAPRSAPKPELHHTRGLARKLRESIEGLSRVAVIDGGDLADHDPPSAEPAWVPAAVLAATLLDGADFVAARSLSLTVIGLRLSDAARSLWCQLRPDANFGAIVATVWGIAHGLDRASAKAAAHERHSWSIGGESPIRDEVLAFARRASEVSGVVVLSEGAEPSPIFASGVRAFSRERCLDLARRRREAFAYTLSAGDAPASGSLAPFYLKTIATGEPDVWCFGAEIGAAGAKTLWLYLDRRSSQGLGWAYLASLMRALSRLEEVVVP